MRRVLLVDDDATTLAILERVLRDARYEVFSTGQPEKVLELAAEKAVDVIVLDVMMPGLSGFDVLRRLRADRRTEGIPILFLSALTEGVDRVRGLREGADDYIAKPVVPEELVLRLQRLLSPRSASFTGLEGNLEVYSFSEVIQNLHAAKKSGLLALVSRAGSGWIALKKGQAVDATLGALRDADAILAMSHLNHGHFRFEPGEPSDRPEPGPEIPLGALLLHAAWMSDELERRRAFLPHAEAPLAVKGWPLPDLPEGFEREPVEATRERLAKRPGTTMAELLAEGFAPATTVELALAWMAEKLLVEAAPAPAPVKRGVDDTQRRKSLESAAGRLLDRAAARGHARSSVHVLFQVCGDAWEDLRDELSGTALPFASRDLTRGGTFSLAGGNGEQGEILIHIRELSPASKRRLDALLRLSAGVAVWLGKDFDPETLKGLVGDVEERIQDRTGLLIAGGPEARRKAAELTSGRSRWRVAPESAATLDA
ncbi:MAG TPA: response regulator, partial [Thermoanaerobaculia bacterium]|nr:response regulator [Thermoanaerobaculia bacterium]